MYQKKASVSGNELHKVCLPLIRNMSELRTFRLRCTRSYDVSHLNVMNIKILFVRGPEFSDDESINGLFSGCPMLEELSIKECELKNISVFNISSTALKSLIIDCWSKGGYKLVLHTPNLQDLEYEDRVAEGYALNKLNAFVNANISFLRRDFLSMMLCSSPLPKFFHLICLDIGGYVAWNLLLDFLESSPQLETLIFMGLLQDKFEENQTCSWYPPENISSCLLFHLKQIEINCFRGKSDKVKMAKYFLKNSKVLEKLKFHASSWTDTKSAEICIVLMSPRGSEKCRVVIS
ncbi:F-box/FBD/LRR-repeat protein At3g26920-like [Cornus florida]|uniref:F-box/FBD/LRR-repeat protein At3g26920-like n=1 Tax=Cornus florida TaxID=4283 RepID=UPI0028A14C3B|nr:F-box/FBD/LRR-repeat protein At3g26920-like [Cornus florida]